MATFTVTTAADTIDSSDGQLSLREAIARANASVGVDTIDFASALEGGRLVLARGQLTISDDVRIDGDRDHDGAVVTIDGGGNGRVLQIGGAGTDASLADLAITGGRVEGGNGGGILLRGGNSLNLSRCTISQNSVGEYHVRYQSGGGIFAEADSHLTIVASTISGNRANDSGGGIAGAAGVTLSIQGSRLLDNSSDFNGGAIALAEGGTLVLERSFAQGNAIGDYGGLGGAIAVNNGAVTVARSTISGNHGGEHGGGGIAATNDSVLAVSSSTITGNTLAYGHGAGIYLHTSRLEIANSIVAGNIAPDGYGTWTADDIAGAIASSNGRNIFGSAVQGEAEGDLENVSPARLFAVLDPATGGGQAASNGGPTPTVALRDDIANPALSGADPRSAPPPQPGISNPDIGAFELDQASISTKPTGGNDVLLGTTDADSIQALGGNDRVTGFAGDDTLHGGTGSDTLRGGNGGDALYGNEGADLLQGGVGGDQLFGGTGNDVLYGGSGKDIQAGGNGGDVFDHDAIDHSRAGSSRDVIEGFAHLRDAIDLSGIDADTARAGNQAFAFVGTDPLTGTGEVGYFTSGSNTIIRASVDVDNAAELEIQLTGLKTLSAADFLL